MAVYYHQQTNEKVQAIKVKDIRETFANSEGEVTVTQGNYIVTFEDGHKIGVAAADFEFLYAKTINKSLSE